MRRVLPRVFCAGIALFLVSGLAQAQEIRVGGGGAAIATVFAPLKMDYEKASGDLLTILQSTPVKGLIALEKGEVDVATAAVHLESMVAGAAREGVKIDPASLQQAEVAKNRVVVFVHKSNATKRLSKGQLKKIFTGKIVNWKELGGNDEQIMVVWGTATPGQNALFSKEILDNESVAPNAIKATDYLSIRETIKATQGAIGIDPEGMTVATVNVVDIPIVTSPIIVVTKGKPSAKVEKLLAYYNEEFGYLAK
jgi:phosphate transport system substrate-binding protein